tara:strand:+ start:8556 stop:8858 length:303 start_codon:yes stop_codon:yes gene_type:complete
MACESPCFDCPYLKGSDKLEIADNVIFDYMFKHHTGEGGYESVICPEQEDICFGQLQMIANGLKTDVDPFSDIGEAVETLPRNTKDYFHGPWEYMAYHDK